MYYSIYLLKLLVEKTLISFNSKKNMNIKRAKGNCGFPYLNIHNDKKNIKDLESIIRPNVKFYFMLE